MTNATTPSLGQHLLRALDPETSANWGHAGWMATLHMLLSRATPAALDMALGRACSQAAIEAAPAVSAPQLFVAEVVKGLEGLSSLEAHATGCLMKGYPSTMEKLFSGFVYPAFLANRESAAA